MSTTTKDADTSRNADGPQIVEARMTCYPYIFAGGVKRKIKIVEGTSGVVLKDIEGSGDRKLVLFEIGTTESVQVEIWSRLLTPIHPYRKRL